MAFEFEQYDKWLKGVVRFPSPNYAAFGLAGESGEVMENIKKLHRKYGDGWVKKATDGEKFDILDELGDVLWYVTRLAHLMGGSLEEVAIYNKQKLTTRHQKYVPAA